MDKIGIRTIVVNFDDEQLPYLSLVQGDAKTRGFDIVICDSDGKEIPPNNDYIVELVATGSNAPDKPYANRHTIKDGKYRVMIPTEALSESGFVFLQLVFYQKSTGAVIHTIEQKCPVYRSRGQEVVESNNLYVDITALRLALEDEATRKSNEIKREEREWLRRTQEHDRVTAEEERKAQEIARKSAEDKRVTAEEVREEREWLRRTQEAKRITAEKEREVNEAQRQKNKLVAGANIQIDGATNTISATDTKTTINGKTGAISKSDITALGIPSQDTVYTHPPGTNPHGTTKSDVGLNNVDNVKQMPISGGILENYTEKLVTVSEYGGSINLSLGNIFQHSPSGNRTYSIANAVNGQAHSFTLIINMGSTVRALTFPASVKWQGGEIPDLSTANKTYVLTFMTVDGGSNWLGMFGGEF